MNQTPNLQKLMALAASRLGKTPEQLEKELTSGKLESLLAAMDPQAREKAERVLRNRELAKQMLAGKEATEMLSKLGRQ